MEKPEQQLGRAVDAVVLGFSKVPLLVERSFDPLRRLKQEGVLRTIHYVTWDGPELDAIVAPILDMPEVQVTRVPQPVAHGEPYQKTIVYQIHNLDAALSLIAEEDTLVLKSRPDFVAKLDFLRDKIENFDLDCEIDTAPTALGVQMPKPIFRSKIWTPWADASQPFFYEDAAFLGRKDDLLQLTLPVSRADLGMLEIAPVTHYYHIVRFAKAFLPRYPIFRRYLKNYHLITNNMPYRTKLLPHVVKNPYFLLLMVTHAWILHSHFHVDIGEQGDLQFFPNTRNKDTDWANPNACRISRSRTKTLGSGAPGNFLDAWCSISSDRSPASWMINGRMLCLQRKFPMSRKQGLRGLCNTLCSRAPATSRSLSASFMTTSRYSIAPT